ncbi:hypothetical protein E5288_WYG007060 [Bos mutus]|uniref:Uncharacterized protein n=1 Tax=Bos mutus TaxID=72004 RepID=A0A6B0QX04_9CETA|nr:hypothetical protein [Bos mutus]
MTMVTMLAKPNVLKNSGNNVDSASGGLHQREEDQNTDISVELVFLDLILNQYTCPNEISCWPGWPQSPEEQLHVGGHLIHLVSSKGKPWIFKEPGRGAAEEETVGHAGLPGCELTLSASTIQLPCALGQGRL